MSAVALLHNHLLQQEDAPGATAKGKGKGKPKEAPAAPEGLLLWARQVSGEGAHLKKWRLILRNLPFNVRSVHLCYVHCAAVTCVRGYEISQSVSLRSSWYGSWAAYALICHGGAQACRVLSLHNSFLGFTTWCCDVAACQSCSDMTASCRGS